MEQITELAALMRIGDRRAGNRLFELAYARLKRTAKALLRHEAVSRTFSPTVLVHEFYVRFDLREVPVASREHFYALCARVMRQVLIDRGRARQVRERYDASTVARFLHPHQQPNLSMEQRSALRASLAALRKLDSMAAETVWLRFGEELTLEELAVRQRRNGGRIRRDTDFALRWLADRLNSR